LRRSRVVGPAVWGGLSERSRSRRGAGGALEVVQMRPEVSTFLKGEGRQGRVYRYGKRERNR
jgi:hypothetical protein